MDFCRQKHKKRSSTMSQISAKSQKTYVESNMKKRSRCLILPFGAHQGVSWRLFVLIKNLTMYSTSLSWFFITGSVHSCLVFEL